MKQVFFIPPTSHMELSELGTNNLFVLGQQYLKNPNYREYVLNAKKEGRFLILDNGVGDGEYILTNKEVFELAKEIEPNEVIPTDTLFNCEETIENAKEMISWVKQSGLSTNIFMCPQGNTLEEWLECYKWALNNSDVATIGMSKKTIPHILCGAHNDEKIGESRNKMFYILKERGLLGKQLHFLGSEGPYEYICYRGCDIVRSTDSCVAIWMGMNRQLFNDTNYKRVPTPSNYFDLTIDDEQMHFAKKNVEIFKNIVLD